MRFVSLNGRLIVVQGNSGVDINVASAGALPAEPDQALKCWDHVIDWARGYDGLFEVAIDDSLVGAPSPRPAQVFGVGANYADHADESGLGRPDVPLVFIKSLPSIVGPYDDIVISADEIDWEVEVVVVIGRLARRVPVQHAWDYVAGVTAGQDFSSRVVQMRPATNPQYALGKSLPGFGPIGPALMTADEFKDVNDLELACRVNGEEVQHSNTSLLIYDVADIIAYLSQATTLLPGDVIFTGTPAGVGMYRSPQRYLSAGDVVESYVEGVGHMRHQFVAERPLAMDAGAEVSPHSEPGLSTEGAETRPA